MVRLFGVCHKDVADEVGTANWQEAKEEMTQPRDSASGIPVEKSLQKLSEIFPEASFFACSDIECQGFTDRATECRPGDVFVARCSDYDDGHEHIATAVAMGASGVVAERMVPTHGVPLCVVSDTSWAWARLAHAMEGLRGRDLRVIAVTGTSGKTSTVWLTASILAEAGLRVGVISDLGCVDAFSSVPEGDRITDPRLLASWLRRLEKSGCSHAVVEVSSELLAKHALAGVTCDTVAVTNLGRAHLDLHGTDTAYHAVKERILEAAAADGALVVNSDDPRSQRLVERYKNECTGNVFTSGLQSKATVSATAVERTLAGQTLLLRCDGVMMPVSLDVPVTSTARNAVLSAAIATRYRVPAEKIARGIESIGSIAGRISRCDRGQDFTVFVDRPSNGHSLASTLASLGRLSHGRLLVLVEEGLADQLGGKEQFVSRASRWSEQTMIVPPGIASENPTDQDLQAYAFLDKELSQLHAGDCVLVLGTVPPINSGPFDPEHDFMPLEAVVNGWLELAHEPVAEWGGYRRAA